MRIFWTSNEKAKLAETVYELRKTKTDTSLIKLLNLAQEEVIEKSRRRNIISLQSIDWLHHELLNLERIKNNTPSKIETNTVDITAEKSVPENISSILIDALSAYIKPVLKELIISSLKELNIKSIIEEEILSLEDRLVTRLTSESVKITKEKQPVVLITNLLPVQASEISKDFGRKFNLKFWSPDDGYSTLKSLCYNADKIIGMTDFMDHSTDKLISQINLNSYKRLSGGVSSIKKFLETYNA
jgi:hypothetical protein